MNENEIRKSIAEVKQGTLSRRSFMKTMAAIGIAAPVASQILLWNDVAMADATLPYKPTKAGGGGPLKILLWQAPTLLNPHFALGTKDQIASRVFFEPLAGWDKDGNLFPCLAAEAPSKQNGGLSPDGLSVTWKLKQGVRWHDGKPFTADDVVFTWQYASDLATAAYTTGSYKDITVEKIDDHTVKVIFKSPTPFWADPFVGSVGPILPKHHFGDYAGAKSREAPGNLKPVGTGPYKFVEFKPGDLIRAERNPDYHVKNQPHFDTLEIKGGGDAVSAARAVLQTGEYDYAWNHAGGGGGPQAHGGKREGQARRHALRQRRVHRPQHDGPVDRSRRRALQRQDQAPDAVRSRRSPGDQPADRTRVDPEVHLRPRRRRHRELRQRTQTVQVSQAEIRVRRRQGQQGPR
ncbi:ABC-type transport system substrate-binding protein [Bradyrhizobium sp. LB7.1]